MTMSPAAGRPERRPARRRAPVPARRCGYRPCPDLLPEHDGKGRPESYHKSPRWRQQPGGGWVLDREDGARNCQQMNDAERQAAKDAGVPGLVELLDERTARLDADLAPAVATLSGLSDVLGDLRGGLTATVADADRARAGAETARLTAEREAREADERTRRAHQVRDEALADRERAVDDAHRHQRAADAAVTRALAAERAQGQAEGAAAAHRAALTAETERRTAADAEAARLRGLLDAAQQDLTRLNADLADAGRAEARLRQEHHDQLDTVRAAAAQTTEELRRTEQVLAAARTDLTDLWATVDELQANAAAQAEQIAAAEARAAEADNTRVYAEQRLLAAHTDRDRDRQEAAQARREADAADSRARDAEDRYRQIVTALAEGGFTTRGEAEDGGRPETPGAPA